MKIYLFNDTSTGHAGSRAVMESIYRMLLGHEIIARHIVGQTTFDFRAFMACDAVVVNGEGTIHHRAVAGQFLMTMLTLAQATRKRTALINAMFQEGPQFFDSTLANLDLLVVRESSSAECAISCGGRPLIMKDHCADPSVWQGGNVIRSLSDVVIGDTHPASPAHGIISAQAHEYFGLRQSFADCVATLTQAKIYITGQHHGIYAAALAGIPFVAIAGNAHKIEGLLRWFSSIHGDVIPVCKTVTDIKAGIKYAMENPQVFNAFTEFVRTRPLLDRDMFDSALGIQIDLGSDVKGDVR